MRELPPTLGALVHGFFADYLPLQRGVRPATVRVTREVRVTAVVDHDAVTAAVQRLGWRVYATNHPADSLTLTQAVLAYRSAYLIERGFGRLKGQPLSLTPMYLEREDHVTGLIRLLSVGLRVLTLLEFVVRRRLAPRRLRRDCGGSVARPASARWCASRG